MLEQKSVLVTGGAGFIGSHTANAFLARGCRVMVLDNLSSGRVENIPERALFSQIDIRSDECTRVIRDFRPSIVCHLAAQIDVRKAVEDPSADAAVNVGGAVRILDAIKRAQLEAKIVVASTGGALYGPAAPRPTAETAAKQPQSPYGISKLSAEYYCAYYRQTYGMSVVVLRFGNVYGPRQDAQGEAGVVAIFCRQLLKGQPLTVFGDGLQTRDFVHVTDVTNAIVRAATASFKPSDGLDGSAFNIATAAGTSVLDLADHLQSIAGSRSSLRFAPARLGEQQHSVLDRSKAETILAWKPEIPLRSGLSQTYGWFRNSIESHNNSL